MQINLLKRPLLILTTIEDNYIETNLNEDKNRRSYSFCNKYDTSKVIEVAARVFFLVVVGCFNIGYWVMYVRKESIW